MTDGRTDGRTDRQTDGDRILRAIPRLHYMQRGKKTLQRFKESEINWWLAILQSFLYEHNRPISRLLLPFIKRYVNTAG